MNVLEYIVSVIYNELSIKFMSVDFKPQNERAVQPFNWGRHLFSKGSRSRILSNLK